MTQSKIIGITGTIGSGKTAAAHIMQSLGAYVINADIVAREVLLPESEASKLIHKQFGDDVMLMGTDIVDRKKLARRVFSDNEARAALNAITLPIIKREMYAKADIAKRIYGHKVIVFDAPLLIEAGLHEGLDDIWLIKCSNDTKLRRIMQRDNLSRDEAQARIDTRMSDEEFARYATVIIENDASYSDLRDKVTEQYTARYIR